MSYFKKDFGRIPGLAVVRIGESMEMERYVYAKKNLAFQLGIHFEEHTFPLSTSTRNVEECIQNLNGKESIHGIIVQLPLPSTIWVVW